MINLYNFKIKSILKVLVTLAFIFPHNSYSQLTVAPGGTPTQIISSLIGGGLTVSNVTINCGATAYGTFNGSASNIGLSNGILLTSGQANLAVGPNNIGSSGYCWQSGAMPADSDLITVEPNAVYDICVLEFDVIPHCANMTMRFVFGSEEYPEYVGLNVSDAFGFFISGPGADCSPNGYVDSNVALLPNGTGVEIDSINNGFWPGCPLDQTSGPCMNCAYYVNNCGGTTVQYDGFTTPIVVNLNVCPCATYHWRFVIADAGDCVWDSGVFIDYLQCTAPFSYAVSTTTATCACDGTASVNITSGSPPYSYTWSPSGQTGATATGLCPGTHTVSVTDQLSCNIPLIQTFTIASVSTLSADTAQTNVTCYNQNNGTAIANPAGGTGPYTYNWTSTPPQSGQTATGLPAGTFTVTVTDANGCITSSQVTITQPPQLTATGSTITNVSCYNGNNGSATVTPVGGTGTYTYLWSPSGGNGITASNLSSSAYTVTVTDANGCSTTSTANITQPPVLTALGSTLTNVSCFNGNNGSATVTSGGGTGTYTYLWSPSGGSGATASNLTAGTYTILVTDNNGCSATSTANISQPPVVTAVGSTVANVSCYNVNNGIATVTPGGGTGTYTYLWSPAGGNSITASSLSAGTYTVTVTDANGCSVTSTANITQPTQVTAAGSTINNVSCYNAADGSVSVTPGGGTPSYTFQWSPSGGSGITASNLTAGGYTVTVTDANGCSATSTAAISQPSAVTAAASTITNVSCNNGNNGSATVNPGGGTGTYTFSWSPSGGNTVTASNLTIGTYTVIVTDANGCTTSATTTISQPSAVTAVGATITNVSCFNGNNGSATVNPGGGTGPYTFQWSPSGGNTITANNLTVGTYTVIVTDANGCSISSTAAITEPTAVTAVGSTITNVSCNNGTDGSATVNPGGGTIPYTFQWSPSGGNAITANNLTVGNYTVTVTDANGCSITSYAAITEPSAMTATGSTILNASCFGSSDGSATVNPGGGISPYTFQWSPSGGNAITANNLTAGTYSVTVSDANGCSITSTATITQPTLLTANISNTINISCNGTSDGSATVTAGGGTGTYTYLWNTSPVQMTATAVGLPAGIYTVAVADANGCTQTTTVTLTEPTAVIANASTASVACNGGSDGQAFATASGGTGTFTYQWSPTGGNSATANNLNAGNYTVLVTDANGCTQTTTTTVTEPTLLTSAIPTQVNVSCFGGNNGFADATAAGGTGTYTYAWNTVPVQTTSTASNLAAGNYSVLITDANGCTTSSNITITEPSQLNAAIPSSVNNVCNAGAIGSAVAAGSGGSPGYSYLWTPSGGSNATANNLAAGTYSVLITDANGCTATESVVITEPTAVTLAVNAPATICISQSATITATAGGGNAPYSYLWSNGNTTASQSVSPSATTTYTVTATDANGCTVVPQTVTVNVNPPLNISTMAPTSVCVNQTATFSSAVNGGNGGPYTYAWSNGSSSASTTMTITANTTLIVTINDGCSPAVQDTITVAADPLPVVNFTPADDAGCAPLTVNFADSSTAAAGSTYLWNLGNGDVSNQQSFSYTYPAAGTYNVTLTVTTPQNCKATAAPHPVQVYPLPIANYTTSGDVVPIYNPYVDFINLASGATYWIWNFGDSTTSEQLNPSHMYHDTGTYSIQLIVETPFGCRDTIDGVIVVRGEYTMFIPNTFTPNGDGMNDFFSAYATGISDFDMVILDRWGAKLYHTYNINKPWDGSYFENNKMCQNDVYVYKITARDIYGKLHTYVGHVTLWR
jgi:large repetitive protein